MLFPGQKLLMQPSPTQPTQGMINPAIIQALVNQQQPQGQQDGNQYDTPILNKLKDMLLNQPPPTPDQYKPSGWRRFAAGLSALDGGQKAADEVQNRPYNRARESYDVRAKQLGEGANIEERQLTNKRLINRDTEVNRIKDEANDTKRQLGEAQNTIKQQQADTSAKKEQDIYATKQKELEQKLQIANDKLEQAAKAAQQRSDDIKAQLELRGRQIDVMQAIHQLEIAQKNKQLEEAKVLHKALEKRWDDEHADRNAKQDNANKPLVKNEEVKDASGKVTNTKVTTTQRGVPPSQGVIKVKNKKTGQTGTIGANKFDAALYEKIE